MVEHRLAKARVESSNLFSRSITSHSSSGLGHRPFTAVTRVRTPYGTPLKSLRYRSCGNSSVVEHRLAKARVESSNLFSRSITSHSSSGLGHRPFTAVTRVRTPYGTPLKSLRYRSCGNSSVVEHRLAKARVESSNLFSRSMQTPFLKFYLIPSLVIAIHRLSSGVFACVRAWVPRR